MSTLFFPGAAFPWPDGAGDRLMTDCSLLEFNGWVNEMTLKKWTSIVLVERNGKGVRSRPAIYGHCKNSGIRDFLGGPGDTGSSNSVMAGPIRIASHVRETKISLAWDNWVMVHFAWLAYEQFLRYRVPDVRLWFRVFSAIVRQLQGLRSTHNPHLVCPIWVILIFWCFGISWSPFGLSGNWHSSSNAIVRTWLPSYTGISYLNSFYVANFQMWEYLLDFLWFVLTLSQRDLPLLYIVSFSRISELLFFFCEISKLECLIYLWDGNFLTLNMMACVHLLIIKISKLIDWIRGEDAVISCFWYLTCCSVKRQMNSNVISFYSLSTGQIPVVDPVLFVITNKKDNHRH
jgi:hypothetical protein